MLILSAFPGACFVFFLTCYLSYVSNDNSVAASGGAFCLVRGQYYSEVGSIVLEEGKYGELLKVK